MIHLTSESRIHLAVKPQDFRKQIDGLVAIVQQQLEKDPRSGAMYVFINRSKTMLRILNYEGNGYWCATKRLTKGKFTGWPKSNQPLCDMAAKHLCKLIKGLSQKEVAKKDPLD